MDSHGRGWRTLEASMGLEVTEEMLDRIERRVEEVEAATAAEVVVVVARQSGSYRDLAILGGCAVAVAALLGLLYLPVDFPAPTVVPLTLVAGLAGTVVCGRWPRLVSWLAFEDRRLEQVRRGAAVAFVEEAVSATRERTGLLVYHSLLEGRTELMMDHGLQASIPGGSFNEIVAAVRRETAGRPWAEAVEELLVKLAPLLADHAPAEGDNPNQIPNRPRVL